VGARGPDAVRIESLAEALGVTKGGFYGHFGSRQAFLEEMLDTWERLVTDLVIEQVQAAHGDARAKLRRLFDIAVSVDELVHVELSIREWGRRDGAVAQRLRRIDNRRMEFMRSLFGEICASQDEAEARSLLAFSLFIANHLISAQHGARRRGEVLAHAVDGLLR
jgi:AcrR family transcriptional regulator